MVRRSYVSADGYIFDLPYDYFMEVGFGTVPGDRRIGTLGNNPDVDASSGPPEDVWSVGGLYPWIEAAAPLEIVSDSASDSQTGIGARKVSINGLTSQHVETTEVVSLNGLTPVPLSQMFFRINQALIIEPVGSNKTNVGNIHIRDASSANAVRAELPAGKGITRQSQFTVPLGHTLQITSLYGSINRTSAGGTVRYATVATFHQPNGVLYRLPIDMSIDGQPYRHDVVPGVVITEKTDFGLRCMSTSADNVDLTAAWLGVLRDNRG